VPNRAGRERIAPSILRTLQCHPVFFFVIIPKAGIQQRGKALPMLDAIAR
jgi:hypothetical protein